ncbi:hypothetical protein HPB47_001098 [Ixodes persulcatus]|uniref:Uncharacterized protein n=1 Tax=Ixodes persulcatus TaxID=34615 RepID=A0AC60PQ13_IXOPE|nr:hypothetical protein HPB47_001098 [Ixodes persulcatus]
MVLTSASGLALVQLAQLADTVMEVAAPHVAPIAAMQSHLLGASANISAAETTENSFRTDIQQAIKALTAQVAALTSRSRSEHHQRSTTYPNTYSYYYRELFPITSHRGILTGQNAMSLGHLYPHNSAFSNDLLVGGGVPVATGCSDEGRRGGQGRTG